MSTQTPYERAVAALAAALCDYGLMCGPCAETARAVLAALHERGATVVTEESLAEAFQRGISVEHAESFARTIIADHQPPTGEARR